MIFCRMKELIPIFFYCLSISSPIEAYVRMLNEDVPNKVRGVLYEPLRIPCTINSFSQYEEIFWHRTLPGIGTEFLAGTDPAFGVTNDRFRVEKQPNRNSNRKDSLVIYSTQLSDEGIYTCTVLRNWDKESKNFTVTVLDSLEGHQWDTSLDCIPRFSSYEGKLECDPEGAYPCCSPRGFCSYFKNMCDCENCIDYRESAEIIGKFTDGFPSEITVFSNQTLELDCGIENLAKTEWITIKKSSAGDYYYSSGDFENRSYQILQEISRSTTLTIEQITKADEGDYLCTIKNSLNTKTKKYTIRVLEHSSALKWDSSGKCGSDYLINGEPGQCDPKSDKPCCNSSGRCGNTNIDCECFHCIDYRISNFTQTRFDKRTPTQARGVIGFPIELACAIRNFKSEVIWTKSNEPPHGFKNLINSGGRKTDSRYTTVNLPEIGIYKLLINELDISDEGLYNCVVTQDGEVLSNSINLTVIESTENVLWNRNNQCVYFFYTNPYDNNVKRNIKNYCDVNGSYPCCNSERLCGFSVEDCECPRCIDSRKQEDPLEGICEEHNKFRCSNTHCIDLLKQCDGTVDCEDGIDEQHCAVSGKFQSTSTSHLIETGKALILECPVTNLGSDEMVQWRKYPDGEVVSDSNIGNISNIWYIHFESVDETVAGNYSCEIRTEKAVSRIFFHINTCPSGLSTVCKRDNTCILPSQLCNGIEDCIHGEDEKNCVS